MQERSGSRWRLYAGRAGAAVLLGAFVAAPAYEVHRGRRLAQVVRSLQAASASIHLLESDSFVARLWKRWTGERLAAAVDDVVFWGDVDVDWTPGAEQTTDEDERAMAMLAACGRLNEVLVHRPMADQPLRRLFTLPIESMEVVLCEGRPLPPRLGESRVRFLVVRADEITPVLLRSLGSIGSVERLTIFGRCSAAGPAEWGKLVDSLPRLDRLFVLTPCFGEPEFEAVLASDRLKIFEAPACELSEAIVPPVARCRRLKKLVLLDCPNGEPWIERLPAALPGVEVVPF